MHEITEGKYETISTDDSMRFWIGTSEKLLNLQNISQAAASQVSFALRIAAARLLAGPEAPLILDDPFASYDADRLEEALLVLRDWPGQVILFTSGRREQELLENIIE